MPEQWLGLLLVGLGAGVLSGMFGIGGGVVIVPALSIILGFTTSEATNTSLGALLLPVGVFAVVSYWREGLLRLRESMLIAVGLFFTTPVGVWINLRLDESAPDLLRAIYGVFLLWVGWRFTQPRVIYAEWRKRRNNEVDSGSAAEKEETDPQAPDSPWYITLMVGLVAGVASGLFGIGGGAIIVPALTILLLYDQKLAVGTSLGALLLPVGILGVLVAGGSGKLDIPVAGLVAVGLMFGAILGARIAIGLPSKTVKRMYGVFLLFVALRFIFG